MNHTDIAEDLAWYLNGTLPAERVARVRAELAVCQRCRIELASLETLAAALGANERDPGTVEPPPDLLDRTWTQIAANRDAAVPAVAPNALWIARIRRSFTAAPWRIGGTLAAAFAVLLLLTLPRPRADNGTVFGTVAPVVTSRSEDRPAVPPLTDVAAPAMSEAKVAAAPVAAPAGGAKPAVARRRSLARTGTIDLLVSDVDATIARVGRLATGSGGVVVQLNDAAPAASNDRHVAHLRLSVPDGRFEASLAMLQTFGEATARTVKTDDLTDAIVDTDARLRNLRREEGDLLHIMDRSGKVSEILDVEQQLAAVREQIEQLDAQSKAMLGRVAYATIDVAITSERTVAPAHASLGAVTGNLWTAAIRSVGNFTLRLLGRAFVLVAYSPYLVALGVLAYVLVRRYRRSVR